MRVNLATFGATPAARLIVEALEGLAESDAAGRHQLTSDPDDADAVVFVDPHLCNDDPFLEVLDCHRVYREVPSRCFLYHQGDGPVYTLPGVYVSASPLWLRRLPVLGGPYCPVLTSVPPADREPDILYSFRGYPSSAVRERLFGLGAPAAGDPAGIIEKSEATPWGGKSDTREITFAQVRQITLIHRSKFVLCPRGRGPSSFRIFEALAAGRVPVIISDTWVSPPRVDWERSSLRIRERDVARIPDILAAAEPRWPELAAGAREAGAVFSDAYMWDHIIESVASVAELPRSRRDPMFMRVQKARIRAGAARRRLLGNTELNGGLGLRRDAYGRK